MTCLGCKHFSIDTAIEDWSEWTPGQEFRMACANNIWKFDAYKEDTESFCKKLRMAKDCAYYVFDEKRAE